MYRSQGMLYPGIPSVCVLMVLDQITWWATLGGKTYTFHGHHPSAIPPWQHTVHDYVQLKQKTLDKH